jgi:hypothetical protein
MAKNVEQNTSTASPAAANAEVGRTENLVVLRGRSASEVSERETAAGTVSEWSMRTRGLVDGRGVNELVPLVWSGPSDRFDVGGDGDVIVRGRVRQRFFRSGGLTVSRTEVVIDDAVPVRRKAGVAKLLAAAAVECQAMA